MDYLLGLQNTRWGMNKREIVDSMPAETFARVTRMAYGRFYADLIVPSVKIGKFDFDVAMQMDKASNQLEQVLLPHVGDPLRIDRTIPGTALRLLSERFGAPRRVGTSDEWEWVFPTTNTNLSEFVIEEIAYHVNIMFSPSETRPGAQAAF